MIVLLLVVFRRNRPSGDETDRLRDRVEDLERQVERLEAERPEIDRESESVEDGP